MGIKKGSKEAVEYIDDIEYVSNKYVMRCFTVTMIVFALTFVLDMVNIFIIDKALMLKAFIPSVIIYLCMRLIVCRKNMSKPIMKYIILFSIISVFTIMGTFLTYHTVLLPILPILFAALYSRRKVVIYVYILTVLSTIIQVHVGYFVGLCDANMVLLTASKMSEYVKDGSFILTKINSNVYVSLALFYVLPRCLIYIVFMTVCESIYRILSGSLEKARLTEELRVRKEEAERANEAKTKFLARISHEIRTPINAVIGMNEMIIRESKEEDIKKYAMDAKEASVILLNIINELLDTSKIEAGKIVLETVDYELNPMIDDVCKMISIKAKNKGIDVSVNVDKTLPKYYNGDARLLRQILANLLSNAVKYTPAGYIRIDVKGRVEGDNARLHFAVKDSGMGIKKEDLAKLAEEFTRFNKDNPYIEGTGLGLNIVKTFLELMDSELIVESEYGKGSVFSFELVQKIVNKAETVIESDVDLQEEKVEAPKKKCIFPGSKILVVDDDHINLKVFENLLKKTQIDVSKALSGRDALELLRHNEYDLIFLDHMMPEMDGVELFKAIYEEDLTTAPVVMLTANATAGNREYFLEMGFDDFMSKPIMPEKLEELIIKYLSKEDLLEIIARELPEINLGVIDTALAGDSTFYKELFQDFTKLRIKEELVELYENKDYNNYCVRIHGFKNNAYTIGATALGDLAKELENQSRDGFKESVLELQQEVFERYDRICRIN